MIVKFILYLFIAIMDIFIAILPTATLGSGFTDILNTITTTLHYADLILPMSDLLIVLQFFLATELLIMGFRIGEFIYNKIRGSG